MAYTNSQLLNLVALIDRPDPHRVLALARRANRLPNIVRPLAAAVLAWLMLYYLARLGDQALPLAVAMGVISLVVAFLDDTVMVAVGRHSATIAKVGAVLGMFIGLAATLVSKQEVLTVAIAGIGGLCVVWLLVTLALPLLALLLRLVAGLIAAFASPLALPVLALLAWWHARVMRRQHKDWVTSRGTPIIEFHSGGVKALRHDNEPLFVSSSRLRAGGAALALGIPLFSLSELSNAALVDQRMNTALRELEASSSHPLHDISGVDDATASFMTINPASGLPMIDGIGGIDVGGNVFGTDSFQHHDHSDFGGSSGSFGGGFDHH